MTTPLIKISGVGAHTAEILIENGYKCAEDLAAASEEALAEVHTFGPARAKLVIQAAKALCDAGSDEPVVSGRQAVDLMDLNYSEKKDTSKKKKKKKKEEKKAKKEKIEKKAKKVKEPTPKKKKKKKN